MSDHLEDILLRIEKLLREALTNPNPPIPEKLKDTPKTGPKKGLEFMDDDLMVRPREAAKMLGFSEATLARWYSVGEGPKAIMYNGKRRGYRIGELKRWVREREQKRGA